MHGDWMFWGMTWMAVLWMLLGPVLTLGLLAALAVLVLRWLGLAGRGTVDPALQEARLRLARGEITPEEYDRIVAKLREGR